MTSHPPLLRRSVTVGTKIGTLLCLVDAMKHEGERVRQQIEDILQLWLRYIERPTEVRLR